MKLTILQLQQSNEEQFLAMSAQIQRTERNYDELHNRIDRSLINNDNFRKEMTFEFGEMRAEISEVRSELTEVRSELTELRSEMRAEISGLRSEMRAEFAALRTELLVLTKEIQSAFIRIEHRVDKLENPG